jgi:predicted transcriptional regulator
VSFLLLRVVRSIPLGEVGRRVVELERKYGGSLNKYPSWSSFGRESHGSFEEYVEWTRMVHALRAYGEGEDFDYDIEETVELRKDEFKKLTPLRLELLYQLSRIRADSINDLAKKTGRDVKNIYVDLKILENFGFVRLERMGRRIKPELIVQEITLLLG